jgi:hypothetical protein
MYTRFKFAQRKLIDEKAHLVVIIALFVAPKRVLVLILAITSIIHK